MSPDALISNIPRKITDSCSECVCLECGRYIPFWGCSEKHAVCSSSADTPCDSVKECVYFVMPYNSL